MRRTTAEDLIALRARRRLTQRDVAAVIGITTRALRDWESGKTALTPEKAEQYRAAIARLTPEGAR